MNKSATRHPLLSPPPTRHPLLSPPPTRYTLLSLPPIRYYRHPLLSPPATRCRAAFTLIEMLIVVAILGILAAITLPSIQGNIQDAKEVAAKDNLRILRGAIERYANDHDRVAPGYPGNNTHALAVEPAFLLSMVRPLTKNKSYISEYPKNPFNGNFRVLMIQNSEPFPVTPTGNFGWIYKPATKEIRLDWLGTDSKGVKYFDY